MRIRRLLTFTLLAGSQSFSQNAATSPSFEVASVRLYTERGSGPAGTIGGPGTRDPERYSGRGMPLRLYLCVAFATADCEARISGPRWIEDKYDIIANVPPGATKDQFREMLRNLLVERFKLALHHETKTLPVYELAIAKNGPKLKPSVETVYSDPPPDGPRPKVESDPDGFPVLPPGRPGFVMGFGPGHISHWTARQQPLSALANSLSLQTAAGRRVIDKTGLAGTYDFTLAYEVRPPGAPMPDDAPALSLEGALQRQLGLRLVSSRAAFDLVIIDSGEKVPVEN